jgi:RHS repeat-associated protein
VLSAEAAANAQDRVADGGDFSVVLKSDGTVWTWGAGNHGQLGNGGTAQQLTPVQATGLSSVRSVAAGSETGLALTADGSVSSWGHNNFGQVGNGTTTDVLTPQTVSGLSNVTAVGGGDSHSLAVKSDGTVWAWGYNLWGQLGNGTTTNSSTPVQVSGLTSVISVSGGYGHALALKSDGTVWAWGLNSNGQLGSGTTTNSLTPVQVSGVSGVIQVAARNYSSYALKSDGSVWAWGGNSPGRLGDGTNVDQWSPVQVYGLYRAVAIAPGNQHALALRADGSVWAWGYNGNGQLGNGTTSNMFSQVARPVPNLAGVTAVATGGSQSFAVKSTGAVWSWGYNLNGQLGNGSTTNSSTPVLVSGSGGVGTLGGVAQPAAYATPSGASGPPTVTDVPGADRVIDGGDASFVVKSDGTLWTWGASTHGQLGNGGTTQQLTPVQAWDLPGGVRSVAGGTTALALKTDGTVWAWGANASGQVGNGSTTDAATPQLVHGISGATAVAVGDAFGVAAQTDGTVSTWGYNAWGQLGNGTTTNSATPVQVSGLSGVVAVAAGYGHAVALKSDGTVWAWGVNSTGALGNGTMTNSSTPVQVSGLSGIVGIAARNYSSYAVRVDGTAWAWGTNGAGQLGNGTTTNSSVPVQVSGLTGVVQIAAGNQHAVALRTDSSVWTWGYNGNGQLGNGTTTSSTVPVQTSALVGVGVIGAGGSHTLAVRWDRTAWSWGYNLNGQLGNGSTANSSTPVQVTGMTSAALPPGPIGGAMTVAELFGGSNPSEPHAGSTRGCYCRPVDSADGNFWHTFSDLGIPGRGPALVFTRTYNSSGAGATGPFGYGWQYSYGASLSASGITVTVTQENGSQVSFTQSGSGYVAPPRVAATLVHNGDGTYTFTRQARQRLTFSSAGQLLSIADLNGNTTTLSYNGSGQLTTITDPAGRAVTLGWTGAHITSLTDANVSPSRVVQYSYDASGNLSDVTDVTGGNEHFTYDASHILLTMRDPRGNTVTNHYDASSRVDWQSDELNRKTTFSYGSGTTTITDPKGNATVEQYTTGLRTALTKGYGTASAATWTTAYDQATLGVTSSTDPNGNARSMTYDGAGNTLTVTDALGRRTVNTYDALNDLTSTTDPKGVTTTYTYDSNGNLTQVSTPLVGASPAVNQATVYSHGDATHPSDVTAVTDADGKVSHMTYDAVGDLVSSADPLGDTTTYSYNGIGVLASSVSPKGNVSGCGCAATYTTAYGHNASGQVTSLADPLGHVTTKHYDTDGNLDQLTDADGNLTTYVYDVANEQTAIRRADTPQTSLVTDYNSDGTILDQKDGAGKTTTYGYDSLGRVTSVTTPATAACPTGCTTSSTYDGAGNRLTAVDPTGATTTDTYDAANELTAITYSDGTTPNVSAITYDADGQRIAMTDGTGTSQWAYDSLHRLTSYTNGAGAAVGYDYTTPSGAQDLLNRVGHITYPNGVGAVARGYDDAGRVTSVADWSGKTMSFGYDVDSNLSSSSAPSTTPVSDTIGVNVADQVTSMTTSNGTSLFSATYARDGNGQLTSDSSVPSSVGAFRYTTLNQLCYAGSSATTGCSAPPGGSQPFGYDTGDNLTTIGGTTQKFDNADQLCWTSPSASANPCGTTPAAGTTFGYDSRGNRTSRVPPTGPAVCHRYDQANRLTTVATGTGASCTSAATAGSYGYDGDGLRQSKTTGGSTTDFTWDASGGLPLVLQEITGGITTSYIYGPGGLPVEQLTSSRPAITLVGTPSTAADGTGTGGSLTLTLPAGIAAGDQILVATTYQAGTSNAASAPVGFSAVGSSVNSGGVPVTADVTQVFRKTAGSGDTSVTVGYNGTFPKAAIALVYRGADPTAPVDIVATGAAPTGTTVSVSATTRFPNERVVVIQGASYAATAAGSWSAPSGTTERGSKDATVVNVGAADMTQSSVGATGNLVSTFTPGGTSTTQPQLAAMLIALQTPATVVYLHHDQLGSTRLVTDQTGAVQATFTYDPYGNLTGTTGTATTPFLYAGQYRDAESGLYYMRARYYDPNTAQFLSRDPLVAATRSPYGYANDDPLNASDPSGLMGCPSGAPCDPYHGHQPSNPYPWITATSGNKCGNTPGGCNQLDSWAHNMADTIAYGYHHVSLGAGGCIVVCFNVSFQGGHVSLNGGAMGLALFGPSVGWANESPEKRHDTSVFGGVGLFGFGASGSEGVSCLDTPIGPQYDPSDWELDAWLGEGFWIGAQHSILSFDIP